jgi:hypothetical protein
VSELEIVAGADAGISAERGARNHLAGPYGPEPLLRRMLAVGDVAAVGVAAVIVGLWGSGAVGALLLVFFAPVWIVTA